MTEFGFASSSQLRLPEAVSFQSILAALKTEHEIDPHVSLNGDVYYITRTRQRHYGVEVVWPEIPDLSEQESRLRELVPKAVISYGEQNELSFFDAEATIGHLAVFSETLRSRQIANVLSGRHLQLGLVLPGDLIR